MKKLWIVTYRSYWTGELLSFRFYSSGHAEQFVKAMLTPSTGVADTVVITEHLR